MGSRAPFPPPTLHGVGSAAGRLLGASFPSDGDVPFRKQMCLALNQHLGALRRGQSSSRAPGYPGLDVADGTRSHTLGVGGLRARMCRISGCSDVLNIGMLGCPEHGDARMSPLTPRALLPLPAVEGVVLVAEAAQPRR